MVDFRDIIENLQDWGFYDVFLPFILTYVVVFAILEKSKIFKVRGEGDDNKHVKNVNSVIAFVFGLFVIASIQTVQYIQSLILNIVLIIIFILVVLILLGFIFGEDYLQLFMKRDGEHWKIKKWAAWCIGLVVFIVALAIFLWVIGWLDGFLDWWDDLDFDGDGTVGTIILVIGVAIVLYWITNSGSDKKSSDNESKDDD